MHWQQSSLLPPSSPPIISFCYAGPSAAAACQSAVCCLLSCKIFPDVCFLCPETCTVTVIVRQGDTRNCFSGNIFNSHRHRVILETLSNILVSCVVQIFGLNLQQEAKCILILALVIVSSNLSFIIILVQTSISRIRF